ncbi:unnamed protein product [Vitrella brassicaformis CCMP3155]|uniref:Uncharacterized protein n=1 Tax=Vitrella brassicaformis (strain CCMP3155) TaxID=1169540 RepID=A0A0G4EBZ4_VITBC|nr:unnamed protein product [Vitrella brassicaformis CCMP3155]|mmetsp:Transcript_30307/g.88078  ORF Transcript_30307/g.88078 Transcript_30307/m.88078 type:complete len:131 (+) Transcript_30307:125-517(+)|eukprot:CEL92835.1 unnamed protein product [Vitrella brassicaformis CCMP3155]
MGASASGWQTAESGGDGPFSDGWVPAAPAAPGDTALYPLPPGQMQLFGVPQIAVPMTHDSGQQQGVAGPNAQLSCAAPLTQSCVLSIRPLTSSGREGGKEWGSEKEGPRISLDEWMPILAAWDAVLGKRR